VKIICEGHHRVGVELNHTGDLYYYSTTIVATVVGALTPKIRKTVKKWIQTEKNKVQQRCAMVFSPKK